MLHEAVKKQFLSNRDYFHVKRWEGKPWSYKFKYCFANYPEILFASVCIFIAIPIITVYNNYMFPNSHREAIRKYNIVYTVVRDDDPNIKDIIKLKEMGRKFFPE